jgi:hypothetical protein
MYPPSEVLRDTTERQILHYSVWAAERPAFPSDPIVDFALLIIYPRHVEPRARKLFDWAPITQLFGWLWPLV